MRIIIAGAYDIGSHLAKLLSRSHEDITLIDPDGERLAKVSSDYDILTFEGSPVSIRTLKEVDVASADLFIGVTPSETTNITACIMAHALGARKTVAKVDNPEYEEKESRDYFKGIGVDNIIYPEGLAAVDIINGLKMSWVRQRWDVHDGALVMLGIKLRQGCTILDQKLKDLTGNDSPYHIVAIKRHGETIIPGGNDELQLYDMAYFMTTKNYIPYIRQIVGKEQYADVKNVMFMGAGITAERALQILPSYIDSKVVELSEERCEELANISGIERTMIIHGDGRDISLLTDEGIKNTQAFVALTSNAETNILACLTAKRLGVRKTVASVENLDYISMAESLDIGTIINKKSIAASNIYQMLLDADVRNVRFMMGLNANVAEFIPKDGSKVTRKLVKDLGLPRNITIAGMVRRGEGFLVNGNTQIMAGDTVMVFCANEDMRKVEKFFN